MISIAVVVPTYNRAHLIGATLQSILMQTLAPAEVVVVDDGSTDSTVNVVESFGSRVRYIRIPNSGVCRARNVGVEQSNSPWIAFCDSDDLWLPDKLSRQAYLAAKSGAQYQFCNFVPVVDDHWQFDHPKFEMAGDGYWSPGRVKLDGEQWVYDNSLFERLLGFQAVFPSTVFVSRSFFYEVGGFVEKLGRTLSEDLEFTMRCVAEVPVAVDAKPLVGVRKHGGNFSVSVRRTLTGEVEILKYIRQHHRHAKLCLPALEAAIRARTIEAGEAHFAAGDLQEAKRLLGSLPLRSLKGKPAVKRLISSMPQPLAEKARSLLIR